MIRFLPKFCRVSTLIPGTVYNPWMNKARSQSKPPLDSAGHRNMVN